MDEVKILIGILIGIVILLGHLSYQISVLDKKLNVIKEQSDNFITLTCKRWHRSDFRYNKKYNNCNHQDGDILLEEGKVKIYEKELDIRD